MITIKEIAQQLGISTTTVSNVIHGKTKEVSHKTVEKVQKALDELEYIPNINARNLAQNKSKIIGIALKAHKDKYRNVLTDPFFGELVGSIEACVRASGYFVMMYVSDETEEIIQYVSTWNVDGLILVGMLHNDYIMIQKRYSKPLVLIDSYINGGVPFVNVGLEDEEGAMCLTDYLIDCGHTSIALLTDNLSGVDYHRSQGFRRSMQQHSLPFCDDQIILLIPGDSNWKENMNKILNRVHDYTALLCLSDYYAVKIMASLIDHGIRIPEDISVTGFDDNYLGKIFRPSLTTIHQDISEKGRLAVQILIQMFNGNDHPHEIRLPAILIERESVKKIKN